MLLVTAAATKSTTTTSSQMDAHYDFQIRQQHQPSTFHGPARQFGSGGMSAFAMRIGRVAMPLMKKYVLPVAKEFGRNLVSSFVPELANIVSGKKRTRKAVREVLKKISYQNHRQGYRDAPPRRAPDQLSPISAERRVGARIAAGGRLGGHPG